MRNHFLARFASAPAMLAPLMLDRFQACLERASSEWALFQERDAQAVAQMEDDFWYEAGDWRAQFRPYVVRNGILHIPVKGVLLNDFPFAFGSWATGYDYIWRAFQRGMDDGNVRAIALVADSPGGEVAGNFDLVDRIFAARGQKPIRAFAAESAYSAAYSIASAADQITVTRTGGVGSIGVVTMHMDVSRALEDDGVKITFIHAGKHKVDGNAFAPLPDDVKARIQSRIDGMDDLFVATVARNRGMEESAVRATEALTYSAQEALPARLADNVGSLDDAIAAFAAEVSPTHGDDEMSNLDKTAASAAAIDAARAEGRAEGKTEGHTKGHAEGMKAGAAEMQTRCKAILASEDARGREELAHHLAFDTDMTAEAATAVLGKSPKATAAGNRFEAAMGAVANPQVGPDASGIDPNSPEALAASVVASFKPANHRSA